MTQYEEQNPLSVDPRRPIVEVMARLGRETQLHLDERHRHFQVTDAVIIGVSIVLVILATFNIYFVRVLYKDMEGIIVNITTIHDNMQRVNNDMVAITSNVGMFDQHMERMTPITASIGSFATTMPHIRDDLHTMRSNIAGMHQDMAVTRKSMHSIGLHMHDITGGMNIMRHNVREVARPMGAMNPFLPN